MAWLLLLLLDAPSYGYVLRRELGARGIDVEPGTLYRTLRELERDELITSQWMEPAAGPRARVYTITAEGRSCLEQLAVGLEQARASQTAFLEAYAQHGQAASQGGA
jgi:DNA-binding PadR family transcriptional regulator